MNAEEIIETLVGLGVDARRVRPFRENVATPCPLAPWRHEHKEDRHASCSVKINPEGPSVFMCWSASCGASGTFRHLVTETWRLLGKPEGLLTLVEEVQKKEEVTLDRVFDGVDSVVGKTGRTARAWKPTPQEIERQMEAWSEEEIAGFKEAGAPQAFFARGLSEEDAKTWEVGYDARMGRMVFPVRREGDSALVGVVGRALSPGQQPKYHNYWAFAKSKFLYGEHLPVEGGTGLILVEGIFDVIRTRRALRGHPRYGTFTVLGTFGTSLSERQADKILGFTKERQPIYLFFDGDGAGRAMTKDTIRRFEGRANLLCEVSPPDGKDPGDMTAEEVVALLDAAEIVTGFTKSGK